MTGSTIEEIAKAIQEMQANDKAAARERLAALWNTVDPAARPDLACMVAHYMADTMDDPHEELAWDRRALQAADAAASHGMTQIEGVGPLAAFYPSLHLNLGDVHLRLGDLEASGGHLARAQAALSDLPDSGPYSALVCRGVAGLAARHARATKTSGAQTD